MEYKEKLEKIKNYQKVMENTQLPTKWDVEKIESYVEGLFTFAKFKPGRIVFMKEDYPVSEKESPGWMHIAHLLKTGKQAQILEVDWYKGEFKYLIKFAESSYYSDWQKKIVPSKESTQIYIAERWLR
jgi:hypothetical protein